MIADGGDRPTTMTETRTDSRWGHTTDASCASGASDREPDLGPPAISWPLHFVKEEVDPCRNLCAFFRSCGGPLLW